MQEEVTQRTVALCVEATRLSAGMLQQAMKKVLDEMQKGVTGHKTKLHHGKQTLRQLMTASLLEQAAEKPEILLAFADQLLAEHEKNRQLFGEVERLRPKADFYDAFVHEENCTNIRATAKELQIGERAFCRFLMDAGFLYRCPAGYLLPYAKPSNDGLFRVKDFWKYGHFGQQTLITPQGKNVIRLLLDDGQMRLEWKERMG